MMVTVCAEASDLPTRAGQQSKNLLKETVKKLTDELDREEERLQEKKVRNFSIMLYMEMAEKVTGEVEIIVPLKKTKSFTGETKREEWCWKRRPGAFTWSLTTRRNYG